MAKSGYFVSIAADGSPGTVPAAANSSCNVSAGMPTSSYFAKADPVTPGGTGTRYFATDTRGTIFYDTAATVANPIVVTTVVQ